MKKYLLFWKYYKNDFLVMILVFYFVFDFIFVVKFVMDCYDWWKIYEGIIGFFFEGGVVIIFNYFSFLL